MNEPEGRSRRGNTRGPDPRSTATTPAASSLSPPGTIDPASVICDNCGQAYGSFNVDALTHRAVHVPSCPAGISRNLREEYTNAAVESPHVRQMVMLDRVTDNIPRLPLPKDVGTG